MKKHRKIKLSNRNNFFKTEVPKKNMMEFNCSKCNKPSGFLSDTETVSSVICGKCTSYYGDAPNIIVSKPKETGFPRGWKFYKIFVHSDGRVFKRGIEQPKLFGKHKPTTLLVTKKLSKRERELKKLEKQEKLAKKYELKMIKLKKIKKKKSLEKIND